jgi:ribosomal protein L13
MENKKNLPAPSSKAEIKIKENPKAVAVRKAPDEVIAKAIRDMMQKEKLN